MTAGSYRFSSLHQSVACAQRAAQKPPAGNGRLRVGLDQFLCARPCHVIGGDSDTSASIKRCEIVPFALPHGSPLHRFKCWRMESRRLTQGDVSVQRAYTHHPSPDLHSDVLMPSKSGGDDRPSSPARQRRKRRRRMAFGPLRRFGGAIASNPYQCRAVSGLEWRKGFTTFDCLGIRY
jgi:hypothetical protein